MSGIRISEFKKPKTIIVDQARVDSAYGPKSSILLETTASSFSKAGFTCELKGLSRDSLLNGLFVTVPLQLRWTDFGGHKLLLNQYAKKSGSVIGTDFQSGTSAQLQVSDALWAFDNVCVRPNPFKMIRNATLSINGSSFSTRTDAYYTAMCKLFADGRREPITGNVYESYPYTNSGDRDQVGYQKGWFERCQSLNNLGKVVLAEYDADKKLKDIVIQYDIKFPIWFGPFTHLGFPGLSGFDGQSVASLPYCNDIVLECTFTDDPLMDCFSCCDTQKLSGLSVQSPAWVAKAAGSGTDNAPNTAGMWSTVVYEKISSKTNTDQVGLLAPKLCYMFSEPDPDKMTIAPLYTLPSYRILSYEQRVAFTSADFVTKQDTVLVRFPYIRLSNISSLYICMAEGDRIDNGPAGSAQRGSRYSRGAYTGGKLGMACANRSCPIKWDTVKVSMSTQSQVLTNFTANTITPQRQFELFKKYSGNAMGLSFEDWQESSQMLLFSAEELCGIGAFANSFQALTMSIEFEVYRDAAVTKPNFADWIVNSDDEHLDPNGKAQKGNNIPQAIIGRLICLEPELVSISEGAVSVEQVKLSQQDIHNQLMGGAPEIEDANRLDELAR